MPRGAWLAVGALGVSLVTSLVGAGVLAPLLVSAALFQFPVAAVLAVQRRARVAALAVGVASIGLRLMLGGLTAPDAVAPPAVAIDGTWSAQVLTLGSTAGGIQRAMLVVRSGADASGPTHGPWRTYAWLPRYPAVMPTDHITFDATLAPIRADGSEFAGYLAGIHADATVRISSLRIAEASADAFGIAERVRSAADAALARVLPEPMAGLASGILVGRRDRVSREVADSFTTTGLSHVVAISGWNICLLGAVIGGLLSAMGLARRWRTVAIVVALAGFTLLAGGGASVVRAALMGGVALIARETGRPGSAAAALGLAVWSLLLLDPAMALDIGFQLSVCATAGLLAWGSRLTQRLRGADPGRARRWLAESLGVSLAAQAATLPLVLFHFGRLSLVSPVANLVIGPIVAPAMLVATIALVAGLAVGAGLPFVVGAPFALLGWLVLGAMVAVSGILGGVPLASVELPPVSAMLLAAAVALGIGAVAWRAHGSAPPEPSRPTVGRRTAARPTPGTTARWRPRRVVLMFVTVVATLASLGVVGATRSGPGRLSVTVLDVGQGDAILVEGPRGGRILLDSGPDPDRLLTVLDRHVPAWDRRIDLVILTHPHEDHVAGLATLVGRYRVAAIAENGMVGAGPGDTAFRAWLATTGRTTHKLGAGDRLSFDGVTVDVRWPITDEVPARSPSAGRQVNDTSVVLDLRYGERRMLLTGDIEDDVDPRLLGNGIGGATTDRLDVLKVAHHGSRSATSAPWLDALQPRVALISAGTGNSYGHPAPETVARLLEHGARVLRTDLDGDLQVSTDGHDLRSATGGGRPIALATGSRSAGSVAGAFFAGIRFLCAIPLSAARLATLPAPPERHPPRGRPVPARPRPPSPPPPDTTAVGICPAACYDRVDHGAFPRGRGRPPVVAHAQDLAASSRLRRGGRGLIPGARHDPRGPPGGPKAGGDRRVAA